MPSAILRLCRLGGLKPALLFFGLPLVVMAQAPSNSAFLLAISQAPVLQASRQRVEAARNRIDAAGRLADPEAEGMMLRGPGDRDMWELNLRQPLPKRGERAADRDRARAAVAVAEAELAMAAGELAADVAALLAEAEGADARARVLDAQRGRFDAVLKSIEARLATSSSLRVADRLAMQTRVAGMQLEIDEARRMVQDALSEARGRLGLANENAPPPFAAPAIAEITPAASAATAVAQARSAEADAVARVARSSAKPATAVGLRFERERAGMGNEDRVGVAFSSEIPWRGPTYARAEIRAAESERLAAQAEGNSARFRLSSAISRVERADRLADTARRLATETRARLDAQYDALVRAAGAGSAGGDSTVLMAVEIFDQAAASEIKVIEAETASRIASAELWRHAPVGRWLSAQGASAAP
jgi:outer membrane protein, heavy metal efflux system